LARQIDFFSGQSYYLAGEYPKAQEIWQSTRVRIRETADEGDDTNLFVAQLDLLISLAEIKQGLPSQEAYARAFTQSCEQTSHPAEQFELYLAEATRDLDLARRLWLGTRHEAFRRYIESFFDTEFFGETTELVAWVPGDGRTCTQGTGLIPESAILVDAWTGGPTVGMRPGQAPQRLFEALVLAPYGGLTLFELHGRIFADEKFNPRSTPLKLRNVILRLRSMLASSGLGLKILETGFRYRLVARQPVRVRLRWLADGRIPTRLDPARQQAYRQVALLSREFGDQPFQLREALPILGLSRSRASELVALAVEQGWLQKTVRQRATYYRWKSHP
jgi:hypothetical protein